MAERKSLQELTIKDNFMFGAVMLNEEICREVLERSLGIPIERVEVDIEKSIVYHPEYKSVRLDAYAKDEHNTHYNVEMQVQTEKSLLKRARYYHSQIDMELLVQGMMYDTLPDNYVIFICDFDPFDEGKYRYTRNMVCKEVPELSMNDGTYTIFLSTKGTNPDEVSPELVQFLKYVENPSAQHMQSEDKLISKLEKTVQQVKADRKMGANYMLLKIMLQEERKEGREEGRIERIIELIRKKREKGQSIEQIAEALESTVEEVQKLIEENDL